ncbi:PTS sugar transporter subunit IIA [Oceanotoga sp. DSM 15011]|jgi:PTS system ascorbate-specific IIA component|uniref:Ascorbate-specific PTS system EIIA component n=1 Tax=Oceanotoga teriensis TaxID=515440 RepID=A0AA45C6F1_9BACT|nr:MULTISPECIES: PTS sugar transporter subunit IIA [Oceanotoga]MDN5342012.1 ascorbate system or component [Oceanotoga sp.]MDO7976029.1 PTS sugar transporter subunit IIA [Oceanotoga teriensis]PWJ92074.1 PTS system IIA component (L-Asc family) [Oceanotoga teriensis]UYO98976.1 PTS sugar transporter subunit IIA [Oceanotoga sp. DSM 15011]
MLLELLNEKNIKSCIKAKNWEEVVDESGKILLNQNLITENYIEAMKESIRKNGPYVVIADGIALLHARPEDGVKKLCMGLITLKEPVNFGNKDHDPVKVAITLGAIDNDQHIQAMRELMNVLMQENAINTIASLKEKEIYQYIHKILSE